MHRKKLRILSIVLALLAALFALPVLTNFFAPLDHTLDDWRTRASWYVPGAKVSHGERERRVVIVDIDERSLAEQGPWPWSRAKVAQLVETLIEHYGVSGVALDIVFPEVKEDEKNLQKQLQRPQITGAVVYDLMDRKQPEINYPLAAFPRISMPNDVPKILGVPVTSNHPTLMPTHLGHITPLFDSDGSIRHLPPIACHRDRQNECRPLLGIASLMSLLADPSLMLKPGQGLLSPAWELTVLEGGDTTIVQVPINSDGTLTVPYRHQPQDWLAISASQILKRQAKPEDLRGSLVLVGATALGMSDVVYTPVSPVASGLEPHAEVMVALLDDRFLIVPQHGIFLDALALLPLACFLFWITGRLQTPYQKALLFPGWFLISGVYASAWVMLLYVRYDLLLPLTPFALFPLFAALLIVSVELYLASRENKGVSSLLAAYLPKQVAHKLTLKNQNSGNMDTSVDASRRTITVMFADVRGFTGIAEGHKPEVVAKLMHRVFSEMAAAVVSHQGTIDKFIGDAVMAFWNAPDDDEHHALHALAAAQDMLRRLHGLDAFCQELGVPIIKVGIGIETGFALVGNFGSEHRRTYTALGETVVLASRIEGLTAQFQKAILIGETCANALHLHGLVSLGPVQIRGRQQELVIYTPIFAPNSMLGGL